MLKIASCILSIPAVLTWSSSLQAQTACAGLDLLDACNVTWTHPSRESSGSMPLGNGDIGANVWVEENGDVVFYLSKTDSWSENGRLLKLGRVRISFNPSPLENAANFEQILSLRDGSIRIQGGKTKDDFSLRMWTDANQPVVRLQWQSKEPLTIACRLELWRTKSRELRGNELAHGTRELSGADFPVIELPDTMVPNHKNQILWYHRNETSTYPTVLENQRLSAWLEKGDDPLINRTFGGCIAGEGFMSSDQKTLISESPRTKQALAIHVLTAQRDAAAEWVEEIESRKQQVEAVPPEKAWQEHQAWWNSFWQRSWIFIKGDKDCTDITRGYVLQRFINACGGRGAFPIKFNGSIFTVDARKENKEDSQREVYNADYRKWGGNYWFQNTRLPYWSMLASGDFDLMQPLFAMYRNNLPLAQFQTQTFFQHAGAFYPETQYFWGTFCNPDFGWKNPNNLPTNPYIRYYWSGGIELLTILLDYFAQTGDTRFAKDTLLPLADQITLFYEVHWPRGQDGKILFDPAASLETWHKAVNPAPEIAGLSYILPRLMALPEDLSSADQRNRWKKTLADLPTLPRGKQDSVEVLLPAAKYEEKRNIENPELYAVFPYRLFGVEKPDLQLALDTFQHRPEQRQGGWHQDAIQAACLGLAQDAAKIVTYNARHHHEGSRFPAFWGPNYDWTPDQTHGAVLMIALQRMLLQWEGEKMILFPAWPAKWDVQFKLHGPNQTILEGSLRSGKLESLTVSPDSRRKDLTILKPQP